MHIFADALEAWLIITMILFFVWSYFGWRAMRAHEKLADSLEWIARQYYRKDIDTMEKEPVSSNED